MGVAMVVAVVLDDQALAAIEHVDARHEPMTMEDLNVEFRRRQAGQDQQDPQFRFARRFGTIRRQLEALRAGHRTACATRPAMGGLELVPGHQRVAPCEHPVGDRDEARQIQDVGEIDPGTFG
nr:hypothetical protein [Microbacterium caowuchunii]